MDLTAENFRLVMGHFVTGVTVVTTLEPARDGRGEARPHGITVNALSSVSLDPPLVMIAVDQTRRIAPVLIAQGRYAVNVLSEDQQALSDCFAGADVVPDREASVRRGRRARPACRSSMAVIATLECTTLEVVPAGDHDLHIARVMVNRRQRR